MIVTPQTNSIYCAIDIGTSSIKTLIAQKKDDSWHILGFGVQPTEGVKKGCITDLEKTTRSVHYALEEAELKAGCKANIYVTNFSDQYINTLNSKGIIPIRNSRVNADDIKEVIKAAQAIALPPEHRILHAIPQYYAIDHHRKIIDPLGMPGIRLEADVHLVTASMHAMKTKLQILSNFGIQADYVVFDPLAAAYGVLLHDEKELGVALIDLGGGTSKMSIFHQNRLLSSKILPIGGDHVTADLALAFRTPVAAAEVLKMRHGGVHAIDVEIKNNILNIPSLGERKPQQIIRNELIEIMTPRIEEIFQLFIEDIEKNNLRSFIASGIVLTGGLVRIEHICSLAKQIFNVPVRIGIPAFPKKNNELLESSISATVAGLLEWAYLNQNQQPVADKTEFQMLWAKLKNWLTG